MKIQSHYRASSRAFNLVELTIYSLMVSVIGFVCYSFLRSGTVLESKNLNLNHSHDDLRGTFDRLADHLLSANNVATLIGTDGLAVTPSTGPAPGLRYDRVRGDSYILNPPTTAGSLSSTATSAVVWRSTDPLATSPDPQIGDSLIIQTQSGNIRSLITGVTILPAAGSVQRIDLTFAAAVGKSVSWGANQPQAARLVRREAFIVMPNGSANEIRFYPKFEPMPALNDPTKYSVLTDQVSTVVGEATPFSIVNMAGDNIIQSTLRVRERKDARWLADEQFNNYTTYFQLLVNLPSRLRPVSAN